MLDFPDMALVGRRGLPRARSGEACLLTLFLLSAIREHPLGAFHPRRVPLHLGPFGRGPFGARQKLPSSARLD